VERRPLTPERKIRAALGWLGGISDRIRPLSLQAFGVAVLLVAGATLLRQGFGLFGATLSFATYYPAVFLIAVVAGPYAAAFGILISIIVVYWAFIPPFYGFTPLSATIAINLALFAFSAGLVVWLADAYRRAMRFLMRQDRERDLLLHELDHRSRNMLTVIESIVRSTAGSDARLADAMMGRIRALSLGNEMVIHSGLKPVGLTAVLENGLKPYARTKWSLQGEDVELAPDAARATALIVHELATNAAKYGAFKGDGGTLKVTWAEQDDELDLLWEEATTHPIEPPQTYGFGTRLVTRSLRPLAGSIEPEFRAEGLSCRIRFKPRGAA
jgi:two-component sensor histidine kinase